VRGRKKERERDGERERERERDEKHTIFKESHGKLFKFKYTMRILLCI
jgi:hypothetical protein